MRACWNWGLNTGFIPQDRAWPRKLLLTEPEGRTKFLTDTQLAALLKLSDLVPVQDPPAFTTGLVNLRALVKLRVERLLAWDEASSRTVQLYWWHFLILFLVTAPYTLAHYGQALLFTHQFTEWFIH